MATMNSGTAINEATIEKIAGFITSIGIPCKEAKLPADTFLPGLDIQEGCVLFDPQFMRSPGDMLHEAGHLAVLLPADRQQASSPDKLNGDLQAAGAEMGAIAWSWAALTHLGIPPEVVFHEQGYKGGGENLIHHFKSGSYVGLPILQWLGMTIAPDKETEPNDHIYPKMKYWLRQ